jgi:hypothetical protein
MPTQKTHPPKAFILHGKETTQTHPEAFFLKKKNPLVWENQKPLAKKENVSFIKASLWFRKIHAQAMLNELVHFGSVWGARFQFECTKQPTRSLEMKWSIIKHDVSKFVDVCGVVMSLNKRYISLSSWIVQPQITKRESSFVLCIVGFCSKTSLIGMICLNKLRKLNLFVRTNLDLFFQGSKIFNH